MATDELKPSTHQHRRQLRAHDDVTQHIRNNYIHNDRSSNRIIEQKTQ